MKLTKQQKQIKKSLDRNIKMIFLIRTDLKMSKGKIAAQCSHAAINMYKDLLKNNNQMVEDWENTGTKKITLKFQNAKQFALDKLKEELNRVKQFLLNDINLMEEAGDTLTEELEQIKTELMNHV